MSLTYELCVNCHATVNTRADDGTWMRCSDCEGVRCESCMKDICSKCSLPKRNLWEADNPDVKTAS